MGAVIKAPITNFLSLADIDAAANQARAAEQQYQLRNLQMKEVMRKQQEDLQLRELAKQAYTQGTPDTQEPLSEDEVMGLQNLKAMGGQNMDTSIESLDSMSRRVPGTPGGYDREKHADLLRKGGYVGQADQLLESGNKLESGQAKMTAEQMKTIEDGLLNPAAWGKGGLLHKIAPKELKATFAGEFNEQDATKMHQAFMSAKDKEALGIQRENTGLRREELGIKREELDIKRENKKNAGGGKLPSQFMWGPPSADGKPTMEPIPGSKADYDRKRHEAKAGSITDTANTAIGMLDEMIQDVRANPRGTATPMAPIYKYSASLYGFVDPTAEGSTSISFPQKRDLLLATSRDLLKRDANMSRADQVRLENAIGTLSGATTPADTEAALNRLKGVIASRRSSQPSGTSSGASPEYLEKRKAILGY